MNKWICNHTNECGSETCAHAKPHEQRRCPTSNYCGCDLNFCGNLKKKVMCIQIDTDWDE